MRDCETLSPQEEQFKQGEMGLSIVTEQPSWVSESAPPNFPALKKGKAALLKEQERLNTERKALKETLQGIGVPGD